VRILVCIDDDPVLDEVLLALEWGFDWTPRHELFVAHVERSGPRFPPTPAADRTPGRRAHALVDRVCKRLSRLSDSVTSLVSSGDPAQEIVGVAEQLEADVVVMGARGERRELFMGSVSRRVVAMAPTDVLVVRDADGAGRRPASERLQSFRALLAVDGSLGSDAGIEAFARELRARSASIQVVHVVEAIPALWDVRREMDGVLSFQPMEPRAHDVLQRAKRLLDGRGLAATFEWRRGSPAARILELARESGTDVIVVGSRGHSAIRDRVLGSITQRVLRHAPCSVLCARGWALDSSARSRHWPAEWEPGIGMA
jgi:nucleotide-binding universal stress UspA family protein